MRPISVACTFHPTFIGASHMLRTELKTAPFRSFFKAWIRGPSYRVICNLTQDGRWAQLRTAFDHEMPNKKFGYGYMRAPWNLNPSPFVSRFAFDFNSTKDRLPSCSSHYNALRSEAHYLILFFSSTHPVESLFVLRT